MEKDGLIILLPMLISALLGSYLTYYFTIKSKKNDAILKFKEEKYTNLLILLQGFVGETASSDTKKKFFEEQYKSWIYCSDDVIKTINNMVALVISRDIDPQKGREAVGNIVLAMRKDLLGKTNLNSNDFRYTDVID